MPPRTENARSRLLEAAQRLFAEQGVDAVSLRGIIREAGVKHATAVQYHFGDREGLLAAVMEDDYLRVDTRRDAMLEQYQAEGTPGLRALAAILVRPLAQELRDPRGRLFLQIYAQMVLRSQQVHTDTGTSIWRWREYVDPFLPPGTSYLHPRFTALTFAAVELARRAAEPAHTDDRLFVSRIIDVVAAILEAPVSVETGRLQLEREAQMPRRAGGTVA